MISYQFAVLSQLLILPLFPFVSIFGPGGFNIFYHFLRRCRFFRKLTRVVKMAKTDKCDKLVKLVKMVRPEGRKNGKTNVKIPMAENWCDWKMAKPKIATRWQAGRNSKGGHQGPRCHAYLFFDPTGFTDFTAIYQFYHFIPFVGPAVFTILMIPPTFRPKLE